MTYELLAISFMSPRDDPVSVRDDPYLSSINFQILILNIFLKSRLAKVIKCSQEERRNKI